MNNWSALLVNVVGHAPPADSLELRNSFIENGLADQDGFKVTQAQIHLTMQKAIFDWQMHAQKLKSRLNALVRAPYNTGKSQQVPIGLSAYLTTRKHELETLIVSADGGISTKRILSLRALFMSDQYKYWCREHNFKPIEFDRTDTGSTQRIIAKSRNRTGNPTYEAYAVLTQTTGQRAGVLILDDVANDEDRISTARRETVWNKVSNTWIKRVHDKGIVLSVCTPYHPNDANSQLMKSGILNVLQISVKEDKTGYKVEQWNNLK